MTGEGVIVRFGARADTVRCGANQHQLEKQPLAEKKLAQVSDRVIRVGGIEQNQIRKMLR